MIMDITSKILGLALILPMVSAGDNYTFYLPEWCEKQNLSQCCNTTCAGIYLDKMNGTLGACSNETIILCNNNNTCNLTNIDETLKETCLSTTINPDSSTYSTYTQINTSTTTIDKYTTEKSYNPKCASWKIIVPSVLAGIFGILLLILLIILFVLYRRKYISSPIETNNNPVEPPEAEIGVGNLPTTLNTRVRNRTKVDAEVRETSEMRPYITMPSKPPPPIPRGPTTDKNRHNVISEGHDPGIFRVTENPKQIHPPTPRPKPKPERIRPSVVDSEENDGYENTPKNIEGSYQNVPPSLSNLSEQEPQEQQNDRLSAGNYMAMERENTGNEDKADDYYENDYLKNRRR